VTTFARAGGRVVERKGGKGMSRELDTDIAEKIMGWGHVLDPLRKRTGQPLPLEQTHYWLSGIPEYSTDIRAAWLVVEHLRSQAWLMTLSVNDDVDEPWDCRFFLKYQRRVMAHGATAEIAICRAALKAVDVPR